MEIKNKIKEEIDDFLEEFSITSESILSCHQWKAEKWKNDVILDHYIPCVKIQEEIKNRKNKISRMRNEENIRKESIGILEKIGKLDELSEKMNDKISSFLENKN